MKVCYSREYMLIGQKLRVFQLKTSNASLKISSPVAMIQAAVQNYSNNISCFFLSLSHIREISSAICLNITLLCQFLTCAHHTHFCEIFASCGGLTHIKCLLLSDSMTLSQCAMPQALSSHLWTTAYLPHMEKKQSQQNVSYVTWPSKFISH